MSCKRRRQEAQRSIGRSSLATAREAKASHRNEPHGKPCDCMTQHSTQLWVLLGKHERGQLAQHA